MSKETDGESGEADRQQISLQWKGILRGRHTLRACAYIDGLMCLRVRERG